MNFKMFSIQVKNNVYGTCKKELKNHSSLICTIFLQDISLIIPGKQTSIYLFLFLTIDDSIILLDEEI